LDTKTIRSNSCTVTGGCGGGTDTTPPSCSLTRVIDGPPRQFQITVQDTESGLNSIEVTISNNFATIVPAFCMGRTDALVVTATKINQSVGAQVALQVTDVAGNVTDCDVCDF
jgi:hypothetical protein